MFFELASESRLGILRELKEENWKMSDIVQRLSLTTTEAFRQLKRLSEGLLVQKLPEGTYATTQYGKLVLQLSSSLEFVFKYKQYFLTHDVWSLPPQFVIRIGELSQMNLVVGMMESAAKSSQMIGEAQQYMWGVSPEPLLQSLDVIARQIPKGVEYRFLSPQPPAKLPNLENRYLSDIPAIMALTEKAAGISFRFIGGRTDYAGFFGKDPAFLDFVKDLFLHYWEKGKRAY